MKHKWKPIIVDYGHSTSECAHCGLRKIERHGGGFHWKEWMKNGKYIESDKTPKCID